MMWPALASSRIWRVVAIDSARRNRVVISGTLGGKLENASAFGRRWRTAAAPARRKYSPPPACPISQCGNGNTISAMIITTPIAGARSL